MLQTKPNRDVCWVNRAVEGNFDVWLRPLNLSLFSFQVLVDYRHFHWFSRSGRFPKTNKLFANCSSLVTSGQDLIESGAGSRKLYHLRTDEWLYYVYGWLYYKYIRHSRKTFKPGLRVQTPEYQCQWSIKTRCPWRSSPNRKFVNEVENGTFSGWRWGGNMDHILTQLRRRCERLEIASTTQRVLDLTKEQGRDASGLSTVAVKYIYRPESIIEEREGDPTLTSHGLLNLFFFWKVTPRITGANVHGNDVVGSHLHTFVHPSFCSCFLNKMVGPMDNN